MLELRDISGHIRLGLLNLRRFSEDRSTASMSKRELEKAGTTYLLGKLLGTRGSEIAYDANKKPYLPGNSGHLSISHSHDWLAIIVNTREATGVDIELIRDKVLNIQNKFLNEEEIEKAGGRVEKLITYWAAKEAAFKVYGSGEVEFRKHIRIISENDNGLTVSVEHESAKKIFELALEKIEEYILVYVKARTS